MSKEVGAVGRFDIFLDSVTMCSHMKFCPLKSPNLGKYAKIQCLLRSPIKGNWIYFSTKTLFYGLVMTRV